MAILPIVTAPDVFLKTPSKEVTEITEKTKEFVQNMIETMYSAKGIGLAAVQVGVHEKIIVIDISENCDEPMVFINAEIIEKSPKLRTYKEGCLSFPRQYSDVVRPDTIKVKYRTLEWEEKIIEAEGLFATCLQHEIDHTNGIVFVDHIPDLKRKQILDKLLSNKEAPKKPDVTENKMSNTKLGFIMAVVFVLAAAIITLSALFIPSVIAMASVIAVTAFAAVAVEGYLGKKVYDSYAKPVGAKNTPKPSVSNPIGQSQTSFVGNEAEKAKQNTAGINTPLN